MSFFVCLLLFVIVFFFFFFFQAEDGIRDVAVTGVQTCALPISVTFAAPKIAHVFPPASEAVGELVVTDLGIPPELVEEAEEEGGALYLLVGEELSGLLPERAPGTQDRKSVV